MTAQDSEFSPTQQSPLLTKPRKQQRRSWRVSEQTSQDSKSLRFLFAPARPSPHRPTQAAGQHPRGAAPARDRAGWASPQHLPLPFQPGWALQTQAAFVLPSTKVQEFLNKKPEKIYFSVYLNRGKIEMCATRLLHSTAAFIDIFLPLQQGINRSLCMKKFL